MNITPSASPPTASDIGYRLFSKIPWKSIYTKRNSTLPRFGRAMARLRTKHQSKVRRAATQFLDKAAKEAGSTTHPKLGRGLQTWLKQADLEPVFNYLTQ